MIKNNNKFSNEKDNSRTQKDRCWQPYRNDGSVKHKKRFLTNILCVAFVIAISLFMALLNPLIKVKANGESFETYDVLFNFDWEVVDGNSRYIGAMDDRWTVNEAFLKFVPSTENTTSSYIWKFNYQPFVSNAEFYIYPFADDLWGGSNENHFNIGSKFTDTNKLYSVELGVLKVKLKDYYKITLSVDGKTVVETYKSRPADNKTGLYLWLPEKNIGQICFPGFKKYETLTNSLVGSKEDRFVIDGDDGNHGYKYFGYNPSRDVSTIYKFSYTHLGSVTHMSLRDTDNGWNGYHFIIDGNGEIYFDGNENIKIGEVPLHTPCNYELGAIDLNDNSGNVYIYVIINGDLKFRQVMTSLEKTTCGFSIWAAEKTGEFGLPLAEYATVQNVDVGAAVAFKDANLSHYYSFMNENKTSSMVYKFRYSPSVPTYIALRSTGGYDGYRFIFANGAVQYYIDNETFNDEAQRTKYGVMPSNQVDFLVEIGAIDVENKDLTLLFVKINGILEVFDYVPKISNTGYGFVVWGEGSSGIFEQVDFYKPYCGKNISLFEGLSAAEYGEILINESHMPESSDDLGKQTELVFSIKPNQTQESVMSYSLYKNGERDVSYLQFLVFFTPASTTDGCEMKIVTTLVNGNNREDLQMVISKDFPAKLSPIGPRVTLYTNVIFNDNELTVTVKAIDLSGKEVVFCNNTYKNLSTELKKVFNDTVGLKFWANCDTYISDASKYVAVLNNNEISYINFLRSADIKDGFREVQESENYNLVGYILNSEEYSEKDFNFLYIDTTINHFLEIVYEPTSDMLLNIKNDLKNNCGNKEKELEILAYEGPQMGLRFTKNGDLEFAGRLGTLEDLETYMSVGFDSWLVSDASYGNSCYSMANNGAPTAQGKVVIGGHANYDIYWALDLAAEYAHKHKKACKVYVTLPSLVSLDNSDRGYALIAEAYNELTGYVDKYKGEYSPVNKNNQLGGFILKDEPTVDEYERFAALYKYIAYSDTINGRKGLGALGAGYDFECALLQTYTVKEYIGNDYAKYVEKYATLLKDTTISFDNYPFNYRNSDNTYTMEESWFYDMQTIISQANGKTKGTCIQSYVAGRSGNPANPYKKVDCEAEISMQVYTAIAYGFTKLNYFTYWQRNSDLVRQDTEIFQNNMIRWNDYSDWTKGSKTTELYDYAKNTNEKARLLFDILKYFKSTGVQLISGKNKDCFGLAKSTNSTNEINVNSNLSMVVGGFVCGNYNGYFAVNVDHPHNENTANVVLDFSKRFGKRYGKAIVYNLNNNSIRINVLKDEVLSMDIEAGNGIFILPIE